MKNKITILSAILFATIISSCGSKKTDDESFNKSVQLKTYDKKIKGYLSDVFEVIDGSYKFDYTSNQYTGDGKIQVKIKSISKGDINDYGLTDGNSGPLYLSVCDKNGAPISDFDNVESEYTADDLLKDMMKKVGEENWIAFKVGTYGGKKLPDDAASFIITSKKVEKPSQSESSSNSSSTSSDESSSVTSSSNSEDFDKVLDDYENYVDEYITVLKKSKNGDASALSEYPALLEKAQSMQQSLSDAKGNNGLSASQLGRMVKIEGKMLKAAAEMH